MNCDPTDSIVRAGVRVRPASGCRGGDAGAF
jgi:hypothetical protein